jgi:phosphopantothenoylcysteine decarboxylase/phosphopantothenate--cysteine ligase
MGRLPSADSGEAAAMNCIVTAGPTFEPLDEVRRLTNFSTGRLGSELANHLSACGHQVTLLLGSGATFHTTLAAQRVERFTTTADLRSGLAVLSGSSIGVVFHAAAVSDFAFGRVFRRGPEGVLTECREKKIPTAEVGLLAELIPTPKLLDELRPWFPQARLVGWKYEVQGDPASVVAKARAQIAHSRTDACVANGPAYGAGFGFLVGNGACQHLPDSPALYAALAEWLRG